MKNHRQRLPFSLFLILGALALVFSMLFSITKGAADIPLSSVIEAFVNMDRENAHHLMIKDLRLPRILTSALVGAALGTAGAIMQGITRNPMADSGILGINAGAGFAIAICFAFFPQTGYRGLILWAFIGAAFSTVLIFGIAAVKKGGNSPLRLILAGAAVSALMTALSQGVALSFQIGLDVLFWTVGGVSDANWSELSLTAPVIIIALTGAILLSAFISILSMGEEVAKGLGVHTKIITGLCTLLVLALAGVSVACVGAVSFVGLIVPHLARFCVGVDYRKIIPASVLLGALLLVLADLGARTVNPPTEVPLGVMTALLGVPFFLYLERRERGSR
ncbi:MAG: FecCD family ABC transporter permease [Lachnospiraceae bacterium]